MSKYTMKYALCTELQLPFLVKRKNRFPILKSPQQKRSHHIQFLLSQCKNDNSNRHTTSDWQNHTIAKVSLSLKNYHPTSNFATLTHKLCVPIFREMNDTLGEHKLYEKQKVYTMRKTWQKNKKCISIYFSTRNWDCNILVSFLYKAKRRGWLKGSDYSRV